MRRLSGFLVVGCAFICGCPFLPSPDPEAVLEGSWVVTADEPGDVEGLEYEARFDGNGDLVELSALRTEDGATATLSIDGAETMLDGDMVTITVPDVTGQRVFEGTLSADGNTMTGSVTDEIKLGDLEAIIPGGGLTFERIATDPCDGVTCDDGESCDDGECVADDACDGVTCDDGESCVDGQCVADDACDGVTCDDGESCVDGECVADTVDPDPVAGEAFYTANGCAACHGDDAMGPPSLIGVSSATIFDKLSGAVSHAGGTFDGVTQEDADNVAAWIASLGS